jgi:hypothetical protein
MEPLEPLNRSGHERGHLVTVRNVNADAIDPVASPEFGNDLVDFFFADVCGDDRRAFGEQPSHAGRPDAAAGTRYQDSPIFKAFQWKNSLLLELLNIGLLGQYANALGALGGHVLLVRGRAIAHASKPKGRDLKVAVSEFTLLHSFPLLEC